MQQYHLVLKNIMNEAGPEKSIQMGHLFSNLLNGIDMRTEFEFLTPNNRNIFSRNFQTFLPEYRVLLKKK